ncbi:hypothetical protein [Streptomyces sp. NPDC093105]|uniref:hypothetical protein n=1 Tax=Streptomyces sp. NPDC093105 TaxID=3366029 RepID=UPI00380843BF
MLRIAVADHADDPTHTLKTLDLVGLVLGQHLGQGTGIPTWPVMTAVRASWPLSITGAGSALSQSGHGPGGVVLDGVRDGRGAGAPSGRKDIPPAPDQPRTAHSPLGLTTSAPEAG